MGGSGCPVLMFLAWCLEDAKCQMGLACSSWFSWGCFAVCLLVLLGVLTLLLPGDTPQVRHPRVCLETLSRRAIPGTR